MGIVRSLFRRGEEEKVQEPGAQPIEAQKTPQLFILTPDAAGIAAYQISQYDSATEAQAYMDEHLRGDLREGTIGFWGLTWLPAPSDEGNAVEPVVLIRDVRGRGQVYMFSFADIRTAYDFICHEMKAGLDLGQVGVYWALQARITVDFWGRTTIVPPNPPRRRMQIVARRDGELEVLDTDEEPVGDDVTGAPAPEPLPESIVDLKEDELDTVVRILDSRGMGPVTESESHEDKSTGTERDAEVESGGLPNPAASAEAADEPEDTIHVHISDVYGGPTRIERKTNVGALDGLGNFGSESDSNSGRLPELETAVEEVSAPVALLDDVQESGLVVAWGNISLALDQALDAHVATKLLSIIVWRRVSLALAEASELAYIRRARNAWASASGALSDAATLRDVHIRAQRRAWHNGARALRRAAEIQTGRRRLRRAWLNISWTLEEAVLAYRVERKAQTLRAWSAIGPAIVDAVEMKKAKERGLKVAWKLVTVEAVAAAEAQAEYRELMSSVWRTLTTETLNAAEAQESRRMGRVLAWHAIGDAAYDGAAAMYRHERVTVGMRNAGIALHEAVSARIYIDAMQKSWRRISLALFDAVYKMARVGGLRVAWQTLAEETSIAARLLVKKRAAEAVWSNASAVLHEAAHEKLRFDGMTSAWRSVSTALADFVTAKLRHETLTDAWDAITFAVSNGAAEQMRHESLVLAWRNAAQAFRNAAQAYSVRQMSYRQSWGRISSEIVAAVEAKLTLDGQIAAWDAASAVIAYVAQKSIHHEMVVKAWSAHLDAVRDAMPAYIRDIGMKSAWVQTSRALREAAVAEAQLRIAEANGDEELVKQVRTAIEEAKKAAAAEPKKISDRAPKAKKQEGAMDGEMKAKKDDEDSTENIHDEPVGASETDSGDEEDEPADNKAAIELWRFRENGRFESRDEVFQGFESPPGRF